MSLITVTPYSRFGAGISLGYTHLVLPRDPWTVAVVVSSGVPGAQAGAPSTCPALLAEYRDRGLVVRRFVYFTSGGRRLGSSCQFCCEIFLLN